MTPIPARYVVGIMFAKFLSVPALLAVACLCVNPSSAAVFSLPAGVTYGTGSDGGKTPSGLLWSDVAAGTSLPIRTSATSPNNGRAGAVLYYNVDTGKIQIDPKGLSLTTMIVTYTTGTTNVSGTTPGPFLYPSGTTANSFSPATGTPKTFPAVTSVTGLPPTTFPSRFGVTVGAPLGPSFATVGDIGNVASSNGFFNEEWAFPDELFDATKVATANLIYFRTIGQASNANSNVLGWGSQMGVFQYSVSGITGNQIGAVVPYTLIPEPSQAALVAAGFVVLAATRRRRAR